MGSLILETDRLIIETVTVEDAPFYHQLYQTPDWIRFIGVRNLPTVEDVENQLKEGLLKVFAEQGFGYYLVKDKSKHPLGTCGFMKKDYLQFHDFGFAFLPQYYRQGFGYEAGKAILEYGKQTFGLTTIDAITVPDNIASKRLLEKLDFTIHGNITEPGTETLLELYRSY